MTFTTRLLSSAALLGLAAAAACSDGVGPDDHVPGITVLSGPAASDTIDAIAAELLVMEVRGEGGDLLRSVPVEVTALPGDPAVPPRGMQVRGATAEWLRQVTVHTDAEGRASVGVRFGTRAGTALLTVSAAGAGTDTLGFTILAGAPARVSVLPADTVIYLNTTAVLRTQVGDRYGNPRTEGVTFSGAGRLRIDGNTVTGAAYGSHWVHVAVEGRPEVFVERLVSVAPRGTLAVSAGFASTEVRVFDLDGSNRRTLQPGSPSEGMYGMDWLPDGSGLVVAVGQQFPPRRLRRVPLQGASSPFLPGGDPLDAVRPRFTADGRWVYFISRVSAEVSQVVRARADGTDVTVMPNISRAQVVSPSPDGSRFAWVSRTYSTTPVQVYDVGRGTSTQLGVQAENVAWSPRDDRILYGGDPNQSWGVIGADGTAHRLFGNELMRGADSMGPFDWSPDGEWVVYAVGTIRLRQVATGVEVVIPHTQGLFPAWKP